MVGNAGRYVRAASGKFHGRNVQLRVYDVSHIETIAKANDWLKVFGTGAYHTAVEVFGKEHGYGFSDESFTSSCSSMASFSSISMESGVYTSEPGKDEQHTYREVIDMGPTELSESEVQELIERLSMEWKGAEYDLLNRNCTHFAEAFCVGLGVGEIPDWTKNLAGAGRDIEKVAEVAQPLLKAYVGRLQPWSQLSALALPESGTEAMNRAFVNIKFYHANYGVVIMVFLILMLLSHPKRLFLVLLGLVAWFCFLRGRCADENWKPKLKDIEITAQHRYVVIMSCSVVTFAFIAWDSVVVCSLLVLVHSAFVHPGTVKATD